MELHAFKDDCSPQKNVVFKRLQYWSHQRTAGTSVDTFITELRQKSKECEFGLSENDMLRDKLVFSITDCHLKERLLQERGLTLHRAIEICRTEQEKTPLQAMETEHGIQQVPVDGEMKIILPDKNLHHNTRKHLGYHSAPNMDQSITLVLAAFMPKVQLHRLKFQQPSVTHCVFSERKNVEQLLPEVLHIKEEQEMLIGGQEGNQLCRQLETHSVACPVKEEMPQASQLYWRQQTQINIKEEPSSCTLDDLMKRQSVGINSKGPETARNPDLSSLVIQGLDGTETDSTHTEDRNMDDDDDDCNSWQNAISEYNSATSCVHGQNMALDAAPAREKLFSCNVCGTCFEKKGKLNRHMKIHTGEKPYACDSCFKSYTQRNDLQIHLRVHTGEKPFVCDVCDKCFSRKTNFQSHMRFHTGVKPHECHNCNKCFTQKNDLKRHMRIHMVQKQFQCDVCSKYFQRKDQLNRHIKIHTGEKAFRCDFCSKCFTRQDELKTHTRVHTGEKPYRCDVCSKCFSQKVNLSLHRRSHTGEKPFECNACSICFRSKPDLNKHMKVHT